MIKKIKNAAQIAKTWCGQEIQSGDYYEIQGMEDLRWAEDSALLIDIAGGVAVVNDGTSDITDINTAVNYLKNDVPSSVSILSQPPIIITAMPPFADKTIQVSSITKKLFTRTVGVQQELSSGSNTISYTATFPWVKITGVEVVNSEALDTVCFKVYDTSEGTYSGQANAMLNQFGFDVNLPDGFYKRTCEFDADIFQGMVVKLEYTSISAKTVGVNLLLHEVKST